MLVFDQACNSIPNDAPRLEIKGCENCPRQFTRPYGATNKYCGICEHELSRPQVTIEQIIADEQAQRVAERSQCVSVDKRHRSPYGDWRTRLHDAFDKCPIMTAKQIQSIIGNPGPPHMAISLCQQSDHGRIGFPIKVVGKVENYNGRAPRLYARRGDRNEKIR